MVHTQLMHLLAKEQLDSHMRRRIAEALETLGADEETVQALAPHLCTWLQETSLEERSQETLLHTRLKPESLVPPLPGTE